MNTLRREVLDALEDAPNGLCDACLQKALRSPSHQHVNATCRNLEMEGRLVREKNGVECDGCLKIRVINRLVASHQKTPSTVPPQQPPAPPTFGVNELDDLRRELIQYLNVIDPSNSKVGFSKRVTALRNGQAIPAVTASLMLTHAAYRNELYYNSYQPTDGEIRILKAIDEHLRQYLRNCRRQA